MTETVIKVQIHPLQPRWIDLEKPKYRLYIDDDLITERTWIWDMQTFIEEELIVEISHGIMHTVRLDLIKSNPMHLAQFGLQNLNINGEYEKDSGGHRSELSFILA